MSQRRRVASLVGAIEEGTVLEAGDLAVGDGHVFGFARKSKCMRTLDDDTVVIRRVHADVGDAHVASGININAVAVGVNLNVVDGEVIHSGGQNSEVAGQQNGNVADGDVAAELE